MGYVNPTRSDSTDIKLAVLGSGYGSFKGLVKAGSPVKMISYGMLQFSNLAQPKEVRIPNKPTLFVKSVNIYPLPGEWERTVGFIGTCADVAQLMFNLFQGTLSYGTHMVPATTGKGAPTWYWIYS